MKLMNLFKALPESPANTYLPQTYKEELEHYATKLQAKYRSVLQKLPKNKKDKLGWSVCMAHDGLTTQYEGLKTVKRYIDTWYMNKDINKSFFELDQRLVEKSHAFHQQILGAFCEEQELAEYSASGSGDFVNTLDYQLITNITKDTRKEKIATIMDFGAGYARESNLFTQHPDCREYTVVEAIEDSYVVQSIYLKIATEQILEGWDFRESLLGDKLDFAADTKKINHLMTFDMDAIPDEHFDLIICSNVLNEITDDVFVYVIKQLARILKKGGILYVKDHGIGDQSGHQYYDYDVLESLNFALEYRPFVTDFKDIWTVPRIYRKYGDEKPSFLKPAKRIEPFPA